MLNVKTHLTAKPSSGLWRPCCKGRWSEERLPLGCCTPHTTQNSARQLSVPSFVSPPSSRKLGPRWKSWKRVNCSLKGTEKILSGRKRQTQQLISPLIRQDDHQFYKENVLDREMGRLAGCCPHGFRELHVFVRGFAIWGALLP